MTTKSTAANVMRGSCTCGANTFEVKAGVPMQRFYCHCLYCQQFMGEPSTDVTFVRAKHVENASVVHVVRGPVPEASVAMADEKLRALAVVEPDVVVGCDTSCLMHLQTRSDATGAPLHVRHLAEVLAAALPDDAAARP